MNELAQLISDLVKIDSVNPDLAPDGSGGGEREIAEFVAAWCRQHGATEVVLDRPEGAPDRPNAIAIWRGSDPENGKSIMLNAHMDTVGVAGMQAPFSGRVEGNKLYGRGAYDMKGSLAAIMLAARDAVAQGIAGDIILTGVSDEEYASIGVQSLLKTYTADACIVTEPNHHGRICVAHKGFIWATVTTKGRAAHGSIPEKGLDAIAKMGPVLVELEKLDKSLRREIRHKYLKYGSIHASMISGGQELSSYPERCTLQIERRTIPGETLESVRAELQAILDRCAAADPDFEATLEMGLERLPFEVDEAAEIVQSLGQVVENELGHPAEIVGDTPWMDAAFTSAAGIPTVVYGPAGDGAHALEEWVDLESVAVCHRVLTRTILSFCNSR